MSASRIHAYARANQSRFVADLKRFIRFASVSAQAEHAEAVRQCAVWLAKHLRDCGLHETRIIPTPRHPIVYAEWRRAPGRPTVLIYGHYDVQPADPLNEWETPPFEPTLRGGDLYGRGASDDKGQLFTHIKALESYLKSAGTLPVNVKCIFEGEEEIGSPNLIPFLTRHREALAADLALMSDTRMLAPNRPAITYALRGGLSLEIEVRSAAQDLHSGNFGGAIHNPLQALAEILARLHDTQHRIAIPGFYDQVRRWSEAERRYMASVGPTAAQILRDAKAEKEWGEPGYSLYERTTIRPALSIAGIVGGYQGAGVKAIVPSKATAKLNLRLVPDQDPRMIAHLFREHIARLTPDSVRATVRTLMMAPAAVVNRHQPAMRAAALAYRKGFGAPPVFLRSGGTIPVVNTFQAALGIPTILMGFALPDDRMHAPNEKFHLANFFNGIATSIAFLAEVGKRGSGAMPGRRNLGEPAGILHDRGEGGGVNDYR